MTSNPGVPVGPPNVGYRTIAANHFWFEVTLRESIVVSDSTQFDQPLEEKEPSGEANHYTFLLVQLCANDQGQDIVDSAAMQGVLSSL